MSPNRPRALISSNRVARPLVEESSHDDRQFRIRPSPAARRCPTASSSCARMMEIRFVEERIQKLFSEGHVRGSTHLASGQEAVAVGIARSIDVDDIVTCTYRGHAHALALGVTPSGVIGEICGRTIGCAGGLGGSMHLVEPSVGLMPTAAIIGAGLPIACGAATGRARARHRPHRGRDLRRRLRQYRRLPRIAELRGDPEAAGGVRLREQPLWRVQPHQFDDAGRGHRRARRQLRHARRHRRRPGRRRGGRGDGDRRRPRPCAAKARRWSR